MCLYMSICLRALHQRVMCYNVLQCCAPLASAARRTVAVCCSVLQCCGVLQCIAMLRCVAVYCNVALRECLLLGSSINHELTESHCNMNHELTYHTMQTRAIALRATAICITNSMRATANMNHKLTYHTMQTRAIATRSTPRTSLTWIF